MAGKCLDGEGFRQVSTKEGELSVELMGETQVIHFRSECFVNSSGTMGYAKMFIKDQDKLMFVSRTPSCRIYTILADRDDELPLNEDGVRVWGVIGGEPEHYYEQHLRALKDEQPETDPQWLKEELEKAPQTVIDISMKMLTIVLDAMGGPDGLMKTLSDAFNAPDGPVAQMAEGIGKTLQTAVGDFDAKEAGPEHRGVPKRKTAPEKMQTSGARKKKESPKKGGKAKARRPAPKQARAPARKTASVKGKRPTARKRK